MKNKKIIVSLLVVVMVLSIAAVCLTGCKDNEWTEVESTVLAERLDYALDNLATGDLLNNIEIAADLDVDTTYGSSKNSYSVDFAVKLALDKTDSLTNAFSFVVKNKNENDKIELGVYYDEAHSGANVYLEGPSDKLALKGVKVKDVIKEEDATISDEWCSQAETDVLNAISEYFIGYVVQTAGGLGTTKINKDGTIGRLELPLTALLKDKTDEGLGGLLEGVGAGMVDPYLEKLGIDLEVAKIADVLPELTVALQFKFEGTGEDTVLKNITAELTCGKKDFVINKTDNRGALIEIEITDDFSATVSGDIFVSPETSKIQYPSSYDGFKTVNALNFTLKGELSVDKKIEATVGPLALAIPAGNYEVNIAMDADPSKILDTESFKNNFVSNSLSDALAITGDVLNTCVDYFLIDVKTPGASTSLIKIELEKPNAKADLQVASVSLDAIGMGDLKLQGQSIKAAIDLVAGMFGGTDEEPTDPTPGEGEGTTTEPSGDVSGDVSGDTTSGDTTSGDDNTDEILETVKTYVDNLSIIVKGGALSVKLNNTKVNDKITISAGVTVDSNGISIEAIASGLDSVLEGLPAEDVKLTIKVTDFKLGNANQ